MMAMIDIVLPVYNEEEGLAIFHEALSIVLRDLSDRYSFRVIYVLDRSSDNSLAVLRSIVSQDARVTVLHLSQIWTPNVLGCRPRPQRRRCSRPNGLRHAASARSHPEAAGKNGTRLRRRSSTAEVRSKSSRRQTMHFGHLLQTSELGFSY